MTVVLYQSSAQDFCREANASLIEFLQNAFVTVNHVSLQAYLASTGLTLRARKEDRPVIGESFPVGYVDTNDERMPFTSPADIKVKLRSRITVWDSQGNPDDAVKRVEAIAGAITSLLQQTIWDGGALEWSGHYSNDYPNENVNEVTWETPIQEMDREGLPTGRAKVVLYATWFHGEAT